ncbi:MAG: hypothetical protein H7Z75_00210 [Ferruginibacter sp.]|nr:hypothetical protein [Cytophagales bacterium]
MKRTLVAMVGLCLSAGLLAPLPAMAQKKSSVTPDLAILAQGKAAAVNRTVTALAEGRRKGVRLDGRPGEGMVWLPDVQLTNGVVAFDVRGKDLLQQSFVGVAFHGLDDQTYEAIYFRPFNFRSEDAVRRVHAVQYVAQPAYTWQKLRAEFPGKYEAAVAPAPDPNDWFHVRVEIAAPTVRVFVNQIASPVLIVEPLGQPAGGRLGLWVGNNSGGDFANLTITTVQ